MSLTRTYSAGHQAYALVAGQRGLTPGAVRVAVALADAADWNHLEPRQLITPELCDALAAFRSQAHRWANQLVDAGFAYAAAHDGKHTRPGVQNAYWLKPEGWVLAGETSIAYNAALNPTET